MGESEQLKLPLIGGADRSASDGLRLWVVAAEPGKSLPECGRHLLIDPATGAPAFGAEQLILLRRGVGHYALLGCPDHWRSPAARRWLIGELEELLVRELPGMTGAPKTADLLAMSFSPGSFRGPIQDRLGGRREARTAFEALLFRMANRDRAEVGVLTALGRAAPALAGTAHPALRALLARERAELLMELWERTEDEGFVTAAQPVFRSAEADFTAAGLARQSRTVRARAGAMRNSLVQLLLPGFEAVPASAIGSLGYSIRRLCGFSIRAEGVQLAGGRAQGSGLLEVLGELNLTDRTLLDFVSGTPSLHRRIVTQVAPAGRELIVQTGLYDELSAFLGVQHARCDHHEVSAIRVNCESLDFGDRRLVLAPQGPACFSARAIARQAHEVTVRVSMKTGDDLSMDFRVPRALRSARSYL